MNRFCLISLMMVIAVPVWAKPTPELVTAIQDVFTPAEPNRSLVNSQFTLDMTKVHDYAVVKRGGMPAGQAYWFITRQDYEYRPFIVKDHKEKTYFGKVEVTLEPGTIMVVSTADVFQHTVQLKLLSKDVIVENGVKKSRRDTRAAVSLTFKFPELQMTAADASTILSKMEDYVVPATSLAQAEQISTQIRGGVPVSKSLPAPAQKAIAAPAVVPAKVAPAAASAAAPVAVPAVVTPKTPGVVHTGMSFDDVKHIKGEPKRMTTRGNAVIFDYGDHEVIFVQEKVNDIRWK